MVTKAHVGTAGTRLRQTFSAQAKSHAVAMEFVIPLTPACVAAARTDGLEQTVLSCRARKGARGLTALLQTTTPIGGQNVRIWEHAIRALGSVLAVMGLLGRRVIS